MMNVTKATGAMPSQLPAGDDAPRLNSGALTWEPVILTGIQARMATMQMRMRSKKHRKPIMDQCRM